MAVCMQEDCDFRGQNIYKHCTYFKVNINKNIYILIYFKLDILIVINIMSMYVKVKC